MRCKTKRIEPDQVERSAKRKEKENLRFRSFLKKRADPKELDRQFLELHRRISPLYECSRCRNCCKLLHGTIPEWEIDRDAAHLGMTREELIEKHLEPGGCGEWTEKHLPCGFLMENGDCRLGDCRPDGCKDFPYTDQPDRLSGLYSVLNAVSVCPVAYEIFEELKQIYDFDRYKRERRRSYCPPEPDPYASWEYLYGTQEEEEALPAEELPF